MLSAETPFPQVGSYALLVDRDLPPERQRAELVRIQYRHLAMPGDSALVTVAFPLRGGADGTKRVPLAELIDGTPLASVESRRMTDLRRELAGSRVRGRKAKDALYQALRTRAIWAPHFERLLSEARRLEQQQAGERRYA